MKTGKSTGEDGLPVEIIKAPGHTARKHLLDLCNTAFKKEIIPNKWQRGVVCPIYKKGESYVSGCCHIQARFITGSLKNGYGRMLKTHKQMVSIGFAQEEGLVI